MNIEVSYQIGQEVFIITKQHAKTVVDKKVIENINIYDDGTEVKYSLEKCAHLKKANELYLTQELAIEAINKV